MMADVFVCHASKALLSHAEKNFLVIPHFGSGCALLPLQRNVHARSDAQASFARAANICTEITRMT